eukprot:Lankesteria_metandrocarpae@DN5024_c0_g1_i2.p1
MDEERTRNLVLSLCDLKTQGEVPSGRVSAQIVTVGTRILLHGGADDKRAYDDLQSLEIEKLLWRNCIVQGFTVPSARYGHTLTPLQASSGLVLFGGLASNEDDSVDDDLSDALDIRSSGSVKYAAPPFMRLDVPVDEAGTSSIPQWQHRGTPSAEMFILETDTMTWREPETNGSAPSARAYHDAVSFVLEAPAKSASQSPTVQRSVPLLVVFGGATHSDLESGTNDLYILDCSTWTWCTVDQSGEVPSPRYGHKMCAIQEEQNILLFGGANDEGALFILKLSVKARPDIKTLDLQRSAVTFSAVWSRHVSEGSLPLSRSFHTLNRIGGRIFLFAGMTRSLVSDLYVYDFRKDTWTRPLYEGQINTRAHSTAVLHDKLIVFGGTRKRQGEVASEATSAVDGILSRSVSDGATRIARRAFFLSVLEITRSALHNSSGLRFKLITVGDSGVGKSCLLDRFVRDTYNDFHVATIGVDFKSIVTMVKGRLVTLHIWDTAGQERFAGVTGNYYRNADGFLIVYDATRRDSFESIDRWLTQIREHHECGPTTLKLVIGNKADLVNAVEVSEVEGAAAAKRIGAQFVATSAKTAAHVDSAFLLAATSMIENRKRVTESGAAKAGFGSARGADGAIHLNASSSNTAAAEDQGILSSLSGMCGQGCAGGGGGFGESAGYRPASQQSRDERGVGTNRTYSSGDASDASYHGS